MNARSARHRRARLSRHAERVRRWPRGSTRRRARSRSARSCSPSPRPGLVRELVAPRLSRVPRSQVPRHSEHRRAGLRRGDAAGRVDAQRPCRRRHARCSLRRARRSPDAAARRTRSAPLLIAVTVLTSLDDGDLRGDRRRRHRARSRRCDSRGSRRRAGSTASSARRTRRRRCARHAAREFKLVTPGIRPAGSGARRPGARDDAGGGDRRRRRLPRHRPRRSPARPTRCAALARHQRLASGVPA